MPKRTKRTDSKSAVPPAKRQKFLLEDASIGTIKGQVLATGSGDVGQLGLGPDRLEALSPRLVKLEVDIVDICAGGMHTVCLTTDGKVLTFGCNDEGALGRPTGENEEFEAGEVHLDGKAVQISAGDSHSAALLDDGRVFAWGTFRDSHGNMGMSPSGNEKLPYEIIKNIPIKKIASGTDHLVLLTATGQVYTCGCAEQGQLGRNSERNNSRGSRRGFADNLVPGPILLRPHQKILFENIWATSYGTFCKVWKKNDVFTFGLNNYFQLGLKLCGPVFRATKSAEFSKHNWKLITGGQHHTLALTDDHKCYVIGRKEYGRLGLGENAPDATNLQLVKSLENKKVVNVACGSATSFAATEEGEIYVWGFGSTGQLGTGEEDDCESPTVLKFGKKLVKVFKASSGGQHTIMLASVTDKPVENNNVVASVEK